MIPSILVVARDPVPLVRQMGEAIGNMAHIHGAKTGLDGITLFQRRRPLIVVVDDDLPDLKGESLSSILKGTKEGAESVIYLINVVRLLQDAKADHYISAPVNTVVFATQLRQDLEKILLLNARSDEVERAMASQQGMLPPRINNEKFTIDAIFSPYNDLSGDGMFYWYSATEEKDCIYGYLFDCTGHDLSSYGQAGSLWVSLRHGLDFLQKGVYENLSQVMHSINDEMIEYYTVGDEPIMAAAIIFCLDFRDASLHYCPAGIPEILVRKNVGFESMKLKSLPLGFEKEIAYAEHTLPLEGVQEIVFASDGLSELLLANQWKNVPMESAKHDDVSAIFIRLNKT